VCATTDKTWHNALMIKSNTNTVTVHGLQPLTPYEFRVSFVNELGTSDHSRSITLTTQMEGKQTGEERRGKAGRFPLLERMPQKWFDKCSQ